MSERSFHACVGMLSTIFLLASTFHSGSAPAQPARLARIVAYDGMQAPEFPAGVVLDFPVSSGFTIPPMVNDSGAVAFFAELENDSDPSFSNVDSVWTEGSGSLQAVAVEGEVPGGIGDSGAEYNWLGRRVLIDETGHTAFNGQWIDGSGNFHAGIWAAQPEGTVRRVVTTGMAAPDTPVDHIFTSIGFIPNFLTHNDAEFFLGGGRVAFFADTVDDPDAAVPKSGTLNGIWSERPVAFARELAVVARNGDDTTFGNSPLLTGNNRLGQTIFHVSINPADDPGFRSIWSENGSQLLMVTRDGTDTSGADFEALGANPDINGNGPAVFTADIEENPGDADTAIFKQEVQQAGVVVVQGTVAPGLPDLSGDGVTDFLFGNFLGSAPLMNRNGLVAFENTAATPDGTQSFQGIWIGKGAADLELVAAEGDPAPGLPNGTVMTRLLPFNNWVLSNRDNLLITANFEAPDGTTGRGLWMWDGDELILMLRSVFGSDSTGQVQPDTLSLPDGSTLEVESFVLAGGNDRWGATNGDGRLSGFSDQSEAVVLVLDGSRGAVISLREILLTSGFE